MLGFDPDARDVSELHQNPTLLAGKRASLDIEERTWNNKARLEISWINSIKVEPSKAMIDKINKGLRNAKKKAEETQEAPPQNGAGAAPLLNASED